MLTNSTLGIPAPVLTFFTSKFDFYQTGSRYWGTPNENSDWDFFVQDSQQVREFLEKLGFNNNSEATYRGDVCCRAVYVFDLHEDRKLRVEVQLVSDAVLKHVVQETLKRRIPEGIPDKSRVKEMWSIGYDCFMQGHMYASGKP